MRHEFKNVTGAESGEFCEVEKELLLKSSAWDALLMYILLLGLILVSVGALVHVQSVFLRGAILVVASKATMVLFRAVFNAVLSHVDNELHKYSVGVVFLLNLAVTSVGAAMMFLGFRLGFFERITNAYGLLFILALIAGVCIKGVIGMIASGMLYLGF